MDQRDCDNNDEAAHTTAKCMTYLLEVGEPEGKPDEKSEAEATGASFLGDVLLPGCSLSCSPDACISEYPS